jgi:hypothetical protein
VPDHPKNKDLSLPFSLFTGKQGSSFQKGSLIVFKLKDQYHIREGEYFFTNGTLQKHPIPPVVVFGTDNSDFAPKAIPYFSILAIILLIFFRNIYFSRFQKYFFSVTQNYEIDFNLQKIGFGPLLLSITIILFSFTGFFAGTVSEVPFFKPFYLKELQVPIFLFAFPMIISSVFLFFLSLSGKIFPLIFSDIKVFLSLSILVVLWKISAFGSDLEAFLQPSEFLFFLSLLFFAVRSFLFFQVFKRSYRFQLPLTLFYICTLNLGTFFFLFKVLEKEFF